MKIHLRHLQFCCLSTNVLILEEVYYVQCYEGRIHPSINGQMYSDCCKKLTVEVPCKIKLMKMKRPRRLKSIVFDQVDKNQKSFSNFQV